MSEQRKLRVIKPEQNNSTAAFGITIPPYIAMFFKDVYFTVVKVGNTILLTSGTHFSESIKNLDNVTLEDFKI